MNQSWGNQVIAKAMQYAQHQWYAQERNVLHGYDSNHILVDTPDITWTGDTLNCGWWKKDEINQGIPYCWGGATTIESFDQGIKEGKYAGNVPEDKSRRVSYDCVGVDCSGLLSICWDLPRKISTREIPLIAYPLHSVEELSKGDVFAKVGSHVMFFVEFTNHDQSKAMIIDATRSIGKVSKREVDVSELFAKGYQLYRKQIE